MKAVLIGAALGLLLAVGPAAAPAAEDALPDGCRAAGPKAFTCGWDVRFGVGREAGFETRLPPFPSAVMDITIRTNDSRSVYWMVDDERTGEAISDRNAFRYEFDDAQGEARERWLALLMPAPEMVPVFRFAQFSQNEDVYPELQPRPLLSFGGAYRLDLVLHVTEGSVVAREAAGGPRDLHLADAVGDAVGHADIEGAWFHDPVLDDDLIEVGLLVPLLHELPDDSSEASDYSVSWDLLGHRYTVAWASGGPRVGLAGVRSFPAYLYEGTDAERVRVTALHPVVDRENGTLVVQVPTLAIGSPPPGALFTNVSAAYQRMAYRGEPFDPAGRDTPSANARVLDVATTQVRPFALGGPEVWARLRGETLSPPAATLWTTSTALAAAGAAAVVVLGGGGLALRAGRRGRSAREADGPPASGGVFIRKYHVERELGRGGFASAWLAQHLNLRRHVVIKQLHPHLSTSRTARERFQEEARLLASLDHPHVARVHDVEMVSGLWYIVMEYVDGGSLEDRLAEEGPLNADEATRTTLAVLAGLEYIHEMGVLHLDVKPGNVLLTSTGIVKIVDFGVSRPADSKGTTLGRTRSGDPPSVGTPQYMAPEQVRRQALDVRTDLYAVAVTFYELVAGRFYLPADPEDLFELRQAILAERPDLPLPSLSPSLNAWLARGLAKDPRERFLSAQEMARALHEAAKRAE